ncbi:uncharacterized protein SAPINGB_P002190 [Magnusiomyces paraingens]|uniref:RING-type domain-containing protein n=1 Tax=Magnusiomyces paraingens TaxID=2606893 RepID=A0A5E8BD99_9ASCO|nr:uncharacterized protein SAPINGB_P002190 [Saprochaete ingens]VVT49274.1 unnamed protein product [Saprochaete ingens]
MNFLEPLQDYQFYRYISQKLDPDSQVFSSSSLSASLVVSSAVASSVLESVAEAVASVASPTLNVDDPTVPTAPAQMELQSPTPSPSPSPSATLDINNNFSDATEAAHFMQDTQSNTLKSAESISSSPSAIKNNTPTTSRTVIISKGKKNSTATNQSGFVLKRVFFSLKQAITNQAHDTDVGNGRLGALMLYLISPFSILCIVMALILNRTIAFATTRRPVVLSLASRLMLRSLAVYLLFCRIYSLIQAMTCPKTGSTSPTYVKLKTYIPSYFALKPGQDCPSPSILWNLYGSICAGHFIETFSNAIQGLPPYSESGMTLFEYSMAFQEVQSSHYMSMETLVLSLILSLSLITSHIFGAFNLQDYRLIPSTFFGLLFLSYFGYSIVIGRLFYFPTVCIIGYLPQLVLCTIIAICGAIYGLASFFSGGQRNLRTSFRTVPISLSEDFYTCLVKVGVIALTTATKATYLNESVTLTHPLMTWVDKKALEDSGKKSNVDEWPFGDKNGDILCPPLVTVAPDGKTVVDRPDAKAEILKLRKAGKLRSLKSPYDNEVPIPANVETPPNDFKAEIDLDDSSDQQDENEYHNTSAEYAFEADKGRDRFRTTYRILIVFGMLRGVTIILSSLVIRFAMRYLGLKYLFKFVFGRDYNEDNNREETQRMLNILKNQNKELFRKVSDNNSYSEDGNESDDEMTAYLKKGFKLYEKLKSDYLYQNLDEEAVDDDDDYEDIDEYGNIIEKQNTSKSKVRKTLKSEKPGKAYMNLLWGYLLPECDDSEDYVPDENFDNLENDDGYSTDEYGYEYESDYDGQHQESRQRVRQLRRRNVKNYVDQVSQQRLSAFSDPDATTKTEVVISDDSRSTLSELYDLLIPTQEDLLALLAPQNSEQIERRRMLISHLQGAASLVSGAEAPRVDISSITRGLLRSSILASNGANSSQSSAASSSCASPTPTDVGHEGCSERHLIVTRSRYAEIEWDDMQTLLQTINERRKKYVADDEVRETLCVVCQGASREIILWPCKCFALCEDCRLTLAMKSFKSCVCCRRKVKSFSKIFVP